MPQIVQLEQLPVLGKQRLSCHHDLCSSVSS